MQQDTGLHDAGDESQADVLWGRMIRLLAALRAAAPGVSDEKARHYAVTITEIEKVTAYFYLFVINEDEDTGYMSLERGGF